MPLLSVKKLTKNFDGLCANSNINMETGVYVPSEGSIEFTKDDKPIKLNGIKPYKITALGLARTFQNIRLFKDMTVLENVLIAMNKDVDYGVITALLRLPKYYKSEIAMKKKAMELLTIFHLEDKCEELACNLPYGEQRRLEIARAMAAKPKLLFLDEPAAGMNPQETAELTELIRFIRDEFHISILLIEHDMSLVMNLCERIYVLDYGKIIASGVPEEIKSNKRVIEAYLGEEV